MTKDIGVHGNLFGGIMMQWLDECTAAYAYNYCCTPNMVTLKMDEVLFKKSVKVNDLVRIYAGVERIGNSSITINVEARNHSVYSREETVACSTRMIFVKIDSKGKSISIDQSVKDAWMKTQNFKNGSKRNDN